MKRFIFVSVALTLCIIMLLSVCSCQLSKIFGNGEDTSGESSSESVSDTTPETDAETLPPQMDFENLDLAEFVTLTKFEGFVIKTRSKELTDAEYQENIKKLLSNFAETVKVTDRVTQKGDILNIDFEGYIDGVKFEGGTAKGQSITLSEQTGYIPGFDADLYGIMPGTQVETTVTFPESYPNNPDMAGKEAVFKITVNHIVEKKLPEALTDEMVSQLTSKEYTNVADFETYYKNLLIEEKKAVVAQEEREALWDAIYEAAVFVKEPTQQVDHYLAKAKAYYQSMADMYGMSYESILISAGVTEDQLVKEATESAKYDVVLNALYKILGVTLSESEYETELKEIAELNNTTTEAIVNYYGKDYLMGAFRYGKLMDQLCERSTFEISESKE
ncbi:MAG: FKBP-type peptidyl-prolyl cis-trans isomerase [Clostridia bacterium]|nr:FKBP-type peptidyl-prolyl cis-trans isomerase [Clostridia bacterium]